jgi:hypothetical protein
MFVAGTLFKKSKIRGKVGGRKGKKGIDQRHPMGNALLCL